ncbi:ABC transporter ATP-binding protein [Devosia sp.]|jgi:peptide/nickel transport system ATP-binding protein|uniref:ABC transporter ATP-binding protein n=1 Tax=Devosia sp. TaxID=1871048 RepID=UPI0037BF73AD
MLLEVSKLQVALDGTLLVDGLSFSLDRGERLAIVGQSGSGKSTVGLALAGLLPQGAAVKGSVLLDSAALPATPAAWAELRRTRIGIVAQTTSPALDPAQTVAQIVGNAELVAQFGLLPERFASRLTAAERQLAQIAAALARKPDLLILDEPFALLDAPAEKRLVELLQSQPMAMLIIGHDLAAASALSQRIVVLNQGRVVENGPTAQVLSRPMEDYSRELIAGSRIRARTLMRSPIGTTLLEAQGVTAVIRQRDRIFSRTKPIIALDDVSFVLRRGEALAVVGAAGAGKTTLARAVAGIGRLRKGTLIFEHHAYRGRDLPRLLRGEISLVFSDPRQAFSPRMTLGASIAEPLLLDQHHTIEEQTDRLMDVLEAVGITTEHLELYPRDLGLYELQLVALARALIGRPRLVVLDDPVQLLNARQRGDMLTLINRVRADFSFSALITSSNLDLMRHIADRALILDGGRLVDEGKPGELLDNPNHAATRALADARLPEVGIGVVAPVGR